MTPAWVLRARRPMVVWAAVVAYLGIVTLLVSTVMPQLQQTLDALSKNMEAAG